MQAMNAPQALQGGDWRPSVEPGDYVHDVVLSANEVLTDTIDIDVDSDFAARAMFISAATGSFKVRWADSRQYQTANVRIASQNLSTDGAAPYVISPELILPANGRIVLDLEDTSGAQNTIQLVFRGAKLFRKR